MDFLEIWILVRSCNRFVRTIKKWLPLAHVVCLAPFVTYPVSLITDLIAPQALINVVRRGEALRRRAKHLAEQSMIGAYAHISLAG